MTKTTYSLMAKIERRLDAYVDAQMTHCGHEPDATLAEQKGIKLLQFIASEVEKLASKAGLP